jgi:hypothetical protein
MHILLKLSITKNPLKSVGFSSVIHYFARVVELVDTMDLKSIGSPSVTPPFCGNMWKITAVVSFFVVNY